MKSMRLRLHGFSLSCAQQAVLLIRGTSPEAYARAVAVDHGMGLVDTLQESCGCFSAWRAGTGDERISAALQASRDDGGGLVHVTTPEQRARMN